MIKRQEGNMRASVLLLFLLTGCLSAPQRKNWDIPDYTLSKPLAYTVHHSTIMVATPHEHFPHIGQTLKYPPDKVLSDFLQQRIALQADGTYDLKVHIQEADILQQPHPTLHWWQQDNTDYTLNYKLIFDFYKGNEVIHHHSLSGFEHASIPKRTSLTDRDEVFYDMMIQMLQKINQKMEDF